MKSAPLKTYCGKITLRSKEVHHRSHFPELFSRSFYDLISGGPNRSGGLENFSKKISGVRLFETSLNCCL